MYKRHFFPGWSSVLLFSFGSVSGEIQYLRDSTALRAGLSTHGTPQDGTHCSGHSTASFGRDSVSTGHCETGLINRGIPRDVLREMQQSQDTTGRDSTITGLHVMFCAGSSNHGAPQDYCIPRRSSVPGKVFLCECCTRRTPQDPIDDTPPHDKKGKKPDRGGDAAHYYVPISVPPAAAAAP